MPLQRERPSAASGRARVWTFYGGLIVLAGSAFLLIRWFGEQLTAPAGGEALPVMARASAPSPLFQALVTLAVIIIVARAAGALLRAFGQPAVIGEVMGGIALGPSLLGWVAPELSAHVLPAGVVPFLETYAQLGIVFYLFLVGLELDFDAVRAARHTVLAISHASIIVPFLLGSALALWIYPIFSTADVPFTVFALFVGVSLSVTAFPVLARILTDWHISTTPIGVMALTCAAIDDVTAWCLLALIVSVAKAHAVDAIRTVALTLVFLAVMVKIVGPLIGRLLRPIDGEADLAASTIGAVLLAMMASAATTEYIGIHGFFGAFLFGAVIPHRSRVATELNRRLGDFVTIVFLPAYFALTGMRTEIRLVGGAANLLLCVAIIGVACAGKFGGTVLAARVSGRPWRESSALGVLVNTRGLVELIVLNIGLELHVISPALFAMLVLMALCTTLMTTPILALVMPNRPWRVRAAAARPATQPA